MTGHDERLRADCGNCCGLCCVAPPFDAAQGFGYDKPAHQPCDHLLRDDRCAIHPQLATRGFPGCVHFDCHGAGQRITSEFFAGRHWRDSAETARAMFEAYSRLLKLHELMAMIDWGLAAARETTPAMRQALEQQMRRLDQASAGMVEGCRVAELPGLRAETLALLRGLVSSGRPD